jgi:hypothetical protein
MKSTKILPLTNSKTMKWAGHVARHGDKRKAHSVLMGKLEEKRQLGRHRLKSEDNIKIKHKEI